jgi:hypothetical protein
MALKTRSYTDTPDDSGRTVLRRATTAKLRR